MARTIWEKTARSLERPIKPRHSDWKEKGGSQVRAATESTPIQWRILSRSRSLLWTCSKSSRIALLGIPALIGRSRGRSVLADRLSLYCRATSGTTSTRSGLGVSRKGRSVIRIVESPAALQDPIESGYKEQRNPVYIPGRVNLGVTSQSVAPRGSGENSEQCFSHSPKISTRVSRFHQEVE